ncbi:MAG: hypothetical protein ACE5G8_15270, partial [Anaerolineae bacterium]
MIPAKPSGAPGRVAGYLPRRNNTLSCPQPQTIRGALCTAALFATSRGSGYHAALMKLALAHDWLNQIGGAENVLE